MNKLHVALSLLKMLSERSEINSRYVAEELEISIRTAQRYLLELSALPFVLHNEENNTYSIVEKFNSNGSILKSAELSFLSAIFGYTKAILGSSSAPMIDKIIHKIFHANASSLTHILINSSAVDYEKIADIHMELEKYIESKRVVSFHYTRTQKQYTAEPYSIIFHDGFWYLAAGHEGMLKKFVLEFIEDVGCEGCYSGIPDQFVDTLKHSQSIWFGQGEMIKVTLIADPLATEYIVRKPLSDTQQIIEECDDGSAVLTIFVSNEMELFHIICRWVSHIEVAEPIEYRQFMRDMGEKIIQAHK